MRKKILSLLLAMICLFGAVCPGAALAADDSFDQEKYLEARASHKETNSYKTDVADAEQLLRIIQSIPSKKAEPFKLWLAQVGRERIEETIDPALTIDRALDTYSKKAQRIDR